MLINYDEISRYLIFERKKKKLLMKCKTFEQFERELHKLVEEMKIKGVL